MTDINDLRLQIAIEKRDQLLNKSILEFQTNDDFQTILWNAVVEYIKPLKQHWRFMTQSQKDAIELLEEAVVPNEILENRLYNKGDNPYCINCNTEVDLVLHVQLENYGIWYCGKKECVEFVRTRVVPNLSWEELVGISEEKAKIREENRKLVDSFSHSRIKKSKPVERVDFDDKLSV